MTEENKQTTEITEAQIDEQIEDIDIKNADNSQKQALDKIKEMPEDIDTISEDNRDDDHSGSLLDEGIDPTVETVVEAILFASDEPLTKVRLMKIAELETSKQITEAIKNLNQKYRKNNHSFRIECIAGGYQMMTLTVYNSWLRKMLKVKTDSKLSQAALETLAIIAYKQPVIRADVEAIRGVASGEMIRGLMYKGLVKIVGRAEVIGRPLLYGTTKKFLEIFGLNSLKDLPDVEELKKPQQ